MSLLGVAIALAVFLWSRRLYGDRAGFLSLALCVICPTLLAHTPLVTSDAAAALFFTLSVGAGWALLHRIDPLRVLLVGLAWGGLALAKFSAPLLVPMMLLLAGLRLARLAPLPMGIAGRVGALRGRARQAAAIAGACAAAAAIGWVVLWAAYGFRYSAFAAGEPDAELALGWEWVGARQAEDPKFVVDAALFARRHELFPEAYLFGLSHSFLRAQSRSAFLRGSYSREGWVSFFPYAFAVKTPLAAFGLWAVAAFCAGAHWRRAARDGSGRRAVARSLYRTAPLWLLIGVYGWASIPSQLNIGHRHLLVLYPALYVLAGAAAGKTAVGGRLRGGVVAALLAAFALESFFVRPHYLAFFNALAGGPRNGHRHLVDSSLDWGQDLAGLARWLRAEGLGEPSLTPVYLSYFGTASPEHAGIHATLLPGFSRSPSLSSVEPLRGGVYCVSATMLQGVYLKDAPGPAWTPRFEQRYQELAPRVRHFESTRSDPIARQMLIARHGEAFWAQTLGSYQRLRAGRLFAALRQREPDATIGHSILIHRLEDDAVRRSVDPELPPPELREVPWVPPV